MAAPASVLTGIRRYVRDVLAQGVRGTALEDHDSLLDSGILDSLGIVSLLQFVKKEFGVDIPAEEIEPANFDTITSIAETVGRRLQR
jgi:acyl carrier protein